MDRTPTRPGRNIARAHSLGFLDLPYEIREQIYSEVLADDLWIHRLSKTGSGARPWYIHDSSRRRFYESSRAVGGCPEILATCSQIYQEARDWLFKRSTFDPQYDHAAVEQRHPPNQLPYYTLSECEIRFITRVRISSEILDIRDGDLLVFRDFPSVSELEVDLGDVGIVAMDWDGVRGSMGSFKLALRSVESHLKQVQKFICRLGMDVGYSCKRKPVSHAHGDVDTMERQYAFDWVIHKDEKKMVETLLEKENILQGQELEWTFRLTNKSPTVPLEGVLEFGWGDPRWPRSEKGEKKIRSVLTDDTIFAEAKSNKKFIQDE